MSLDGEVIASLMIRVMTTQQIRQFLRDNSAANHNGACCICSAKDTPVDDNGNPVQNVEQATQTIESHYDYCVISYLEIHLETLEIQSDPELMKELQEGMRQVEHGEHKQWPTWDQVKAELGWEQKEG